MELHVGLVVRCVAGSTVHPDGSSRKSMHYGDIGSITEHVGKRICLGKVYDFWRVDFAEGNKFAAECLIPINPDDTSCGSFDSMMEDLCLPVS